MRELEQMGISRQEAESIKARVWARIVQTFKETRPVLQAFNELWPAEEPHCEHGAGYGYCDQGGCDFCGQ